MSKAVIWDFDGTLIDSYDMIVSAIYDALSRYNTDYSKEDIYKHVKDTSVEDFFHMAAKELNVEYEEIRDLYSDYSKKNEDKLVPNFHAVEILEILKEKGIDNFVYTHKGQTTHDVLRNNNMLSYFKEIVTNVNGYKRKPHPEALLYLIDKYSLDRNETYYVGDRALDVECANNAGVLSIYLNPDGQKNSAANYNIKDLLEIKDII